VYTTAVEGYELASQSVGVSGSAGMSAAWYDSRTGAMVTIRTDGGELTAESCAAKAPHVPSDAELELLFSDVPEGPRGPVERGDIPEDGDGAPIQPVGPGG